MMLADFKGCNFLGARKEAALEVGLNLHHAKESGNLSKVCPKGETSTTVHMQGGLSNSSRHLRIRA